MHGTRAHPTIVSLRNMLSKEIYAGPHLLFSTATKPEADIAIRQIAEMTSQNGHVYFSEYRPGGESLRSLRAGQLGAERRNHRSFRALAMFLKRRGKVPGGGTRLLPRSQRARPRTSSTTMRLIDQAESAQFRGALCEINPCLGSYVFCPLMGFARDPLLGRDAHLNT